MTSTSHEEPRYRSFILCLAFVMIVNMISNAFSAAIDSITIEKLANQERFSYLLNVCFYLPGCCGALTFGYLSGFVSRKALILVVCLLASASLFFSGVGSALWLVITARSLSGFAYGGILPICTSLVGDWFPSRYRSAAASVIFTMQAVGMFAGYQIGMLTGVTEARRSFVSSAGLPILMIGVLNCALAEDPMRGRYDGVTEGFAGYPSRKQQLKAMTSRTNWLVLQLHFPGNVSSAVLLSFLALFLRDKDVGLAMHATDVMTAELALTLGFLVGSISGGILGSLLYSKDPKYAVIYCALTCTLRAIPAYFIVNWRSLVGLDHEDWITSVLFILGCLVTQHAAVTSALLMNVNLPETRGTIAAVSSVLDDISRIAGPYSFYALSILFKDWTIAFHLVLIFWIVSGMLLIPICDSLASDEQEMTRLLDDIALDTALRQQKKLSEDEITLRVKDAADAFKFSKLN